MSNSQSLPTFRNPILQGFNPDPSICVVPGTPTRYFLTTSTFDIFPSCPIYTSTDILNWTLIGHALTRPSQLNLRTGDPGSGTWAPTLRYRHKEKRWYLTTCVFTKYHPQKDDRVFPRGFYVWTNDIWDDNKWSEPTWFDNPGFDQDLFWDDDNDKVYLSTTVRLADRLFNSKKKDFAVHCSEIELATGRTLTPPVVLRQSAHGVAEGSHLLKKDGWYYLFVAEGGTEAGHQEWVFRSKEGAFGPWEGQGKPLWYNGPDEEVQRTGHADVFEDVDGQWWAVFLGVRPLKSKDGSWLEPQLGRETFLVKLDWTLDGWPIFNNGRNVTLLTEGRSSLVPAIQNLESQPRTWHASLHEPAVDLGWYRKNTPLKSCYSLTERPGFLRLHGSCFNLSSPEAPAMLLRKQTEFRQIFSVEMEFAPRMGGYEAGVVVWWNRYSYASIGIRGEKEKGEVNSKLVGRRPKSGKDGEGGVEEVHLPKLTTTSSCHLSVTASPTTYTLCFKQARNEPDSCFSVDVQELCTMPPVGAAFTGVMFGVYSFGKGEPVLDPADFSGIQMIGIGEEEN